MKSIGWDAVSQIAAFAYTTDQPSRRRARQQAIYMKQQDLNSQEDVRLCHWCHVQPGLPAGGQLFANGQKVDKEIAAGYLDILAQLKGGNVGVIGLLFRKFPKHL